MAQQTTPGAPLRPGDQAPDLALRGPDGANVQLASLWQDGPVVLAFLRHFG